MGYIFFCLILTIGSIHLVLVEHAKTVEVHGGSVVLDRVLHIDNDGIAPAGLNERAREFAVNDLSKLLEAIRGDVLLRDFQVELFKSVSLYIASLSRLTVLVIPTGKSFS